MQGARHGQRARYLSQVGRATRLLNHLATEVLQRLRARDLHHVPVAKLDGADHHGVGNAGALVMQPLGEVQHVGARPVQDEDAGQLVTQVFHVEFRAERAHADVERRAALIVCDVHVALCRYEHLEDVRQLPLRRYVDGRLASAVGPETRQRQFNTEDALFQ